MRYGVRGTEHIALIGNVSLGYQSIPTKRIPINAGGSSSYRG